ncbi:MAG: glycosyltransferase family 32 protein, partial [Pararhodobacter sp.]
LDMCALPGGMLWALCLLAERLGQPGLARALAAELLARPVLERAEALAVLGVLHAAGLPGWSQAARGLIDRLPPEAQADLSGDLLALDQGPQAALAARARDPRGTAPLRQREARLLTLTRLLRQCGRVRVAARLQRLALRVLPLHPALFRLHFATLLQAGMPAAARHLLATAQADPANRAPRWREIIAQCWADLDQPARACQLAGSGSGLQGMAQLWYPRCLIRLGRDAEARGLMDGLRQRQSGVWTVHYLGSVDALLHFEATLAGPDQVASQGRLVTPAIRRIAAEADTGRAPRGQPVPQIPRRIVQYWDSARLPEDIAPITESWSRLPGYAYHRLDRRAARVFLRDRLDASFLRAFGLARSATEESDFIRLCLLATGGGIYADCDDWRTGDPAAFLARSRGLLVLREPSGALANNFIAAPPGHPALIRGAVLAQRALLERHNDSTWSKTGPGLLTRAVAWYLDDCARHKTAPALTVLPQFMAGLLFDPHVPLRYKQTARYWRSGPDRAGLAQFLADRLTADSKAPPECAVAAS